MCRQWIRSLAVAAGVMAWLAGPASAARTHDTRLARASAARAAAGVTADTPATDANVQVPHPSAAEAAKAAGHSEEAGHGEEAEGEPNILEPQPSLAIWTLVVFLGLFAVLGRFAWKPLMEAMHQRESHLEQLLREAERARAEGERLLAEHRARLAEAEGQVRAMLDQARGDAQKQGDAMLKKAQDEVDAMRDRAGKEIESAKDQALGDIWNRTADLAVAVAGKVLSRSMNEDEHRRLVDSALHELPTLGGANGQQGARA